MRALLLTLLLLAPHAHAHASPGTEITHDIGKTNPRRKPLLDALRQPIEQDLGQPVQFMVKTLRTQGNWAFIVATPQTKTGEAIDFARTHYAQAMVDGVFDGSTIFALLKADNNVWSVTEFVIGPTDVAYLAWPDQYGAPATLFELPSE